MKNKELKKIVMLLITVFVTISLMAQVKVNRELKGFITQSFVYFPKIKEVENTITTAQEKIALTQLNKLPEVTGDASYNYIRPKIVIPLGGVDFQFAPVSNINTAVNASYMLFDFGRIKASIERSKDDLLYARHNVDNVKSKLAYQVANVYYNIVYLQKAISIQDSVISFLNDNKQIVESKLKNGDALKIDLLNIQANIDNEGNRKVDLLNSLQKQYNLLEYTTGIKQSTGQLFDFDITLIDANAALGSAQSSNVDFLLARDKIKQSQSDLNIVKLGDKPSIDLHASSGVKNGYVPNVDMMKFNYLAGVSLSVPIYNAGKTKQQIRLQQNIVKQNELAVESLSSDYKKDIDQAITDIKSNYERITNTQGQIEEAKYAQQLAAIRFKNGVGTNLELTNSSTNEQRAELTKLQYEYQLCLAKVELARLMGYQYW
jgi:outer membrane protein